MGPFTDRRRLTAMRPGVEPLEGRSLLTGPVGPLVPTGAPAADFDGNGTSDLAVFRPSTAEWFGLLPSGGKKLGQFGGPGFMDVPVAGDYDGDGKTEPAVFRVATAEWFALGAGGGRSLGKFGGPNLMDIPVPADYDGDGKTDLAVFRHATAEWFILNSGGGGQTRIAFGAPDLKDLPAPGDYDGDGRAEPAVFRVATAEWFAKGSEGGTKLAVFGAPDLKDLPAPGDYDGDGRAEPAVFRVATAEWFALGARGGRSLGRFGGASGLDLPAATATAALARMGGFGFYPSVLVAPDVPFRRLDREGTALHEAQTAQARAGTNPVILLGDSIIGHWGGNVGRAAWDEYLGPLKAGNFGVPGDMTQDLLWRVRNGALDGKPRLAVVGIGTNNLAVGADINATHRGIEAVVAAIREESPETKVLILGVLPRGLEPGTPIRRRIADLNSRFGDMTGGAEVRFLDVGPYFVLHDGELRTYLLPDGLHPGEQGYRLLGLLLRAAITAMLGE